MRIEITKVVFGSDGERRVEAAEKVMLEGVKKNEMEKKQIGKGIRK